MRKHNVRTTFLSQKGYALDTDVLDFKQPTCAHIARLLERTGSTFLAPSAEVLTKVNEAIYGRVNPLRKDWATNRTCSLATIVNAIGSDASSVALAQLYARFLTACGLLNIPRKYVRVYGYVHVIPSLEEIEADAQTVALSAEMEKAIDAHANRVSRSLAIVVRGGLIDLAVVVEEFLQLCEEVAYAMIDVVAALSYRAEFLKTIAFMVTSEEPPAVAGIEDGPLASLASTFQVFRAMTATVTSQPGEPSLQQLNRAKVYARELERYNASAPASRRFTVEPIAVAREWCEVRRSGSALYAGLELADLKFHYKKSVHPVSVVTVINPDDGCYAGVTDKAATAATQSLVSAVTRLAPTPDVLDTVADLEGLRSDHVLVRNYTGEDMETLVESLAHAVASCVLVDFSETEGCIVAQYVGTSATTPEMLFGLGLTLASSEVRTRDVVAFLAACAPAAQADGLPYGAETAERYCDAASRTQLAFAPGGGSSALPVDLPSFSVDVGLTADTAEEFTFTLSDIAGFAERTRLHGFVSPVWVAEALGIGADLSRLTPAYRDQMFMTDTLGRVMQLVSATVLPILERSWRARYNTYTKTLLPGERLTLADAALRLFTRVVGTIGAPTIADSLDALRASPFYVGAIARWVSNQEWAHREIKGGNE